MGRQGRGSVKAMVGLLAALTLASGCKSDASGMAEETDGSCTGAKCDDPSASDTDGATDGVTDTEGVAETEGCEVFDVQPEDVLAECADRADEAFNPNRQGYQREFMRWSCKDVDGRLPTERGQEYCEYFSIVQIPDSYGTLGDPEILGMNLGEDFEAGQTPFGIELDDMDVAALEAEPDRVVGSCVFTSWNQDIDYTTREAAPFVQGVRVTPGVFRMKYFANTNEAAKYLLADCMQCIALPGDPDDPEDPLHDPFQRACYLNAEINGTEDRKSDSVICGGALRLGECGCFAQGVDLVDALTPLDELGFPLGTWDDPYGLPVGCRFVSWGPSGQNIVSCDLSAAEVLQNADELKGYCAQRYADDIVVHIPIPADGIACIPNPDETYAHTCDDAPWIMQ